MTDGYIYVAGEDGEIYEVLPSDGLLSFLQRLAEDEAEKPEIDAQTSKQTNTGAA